MNPVDLKYLLAEITASKYKLRGKEIGLIRSMEEYVKNSRYASQKQSQWLQEIYRKSQNGNGYQQKERMQ